MKIFVIAIVCFASGIAASQLFFSSESQSNVEISSNIPTVPTQVRSGNDFDTQNAVLENRELRSQLDWERQQNALLVSQIDELSEQLENQETNQNLAQQNPRVGALSSIDLDALIAAGLAEVDAERIIELENEARQKIQALFRDPETRSRQAARQIFSDYNDQIRQELGDFSYETYLDTAGRPTSVSVAEVADNSRGAIAGIQQGDEILRYGGERVFNIFDLQDAVRNGSEGETVLVELVRDNLVQVVTLPRGQIGITSDNRR